MLCRMSLSSCGPMAKAYACLVTLLDWHVKVQAKAAGVTLLAL